LCSAENFKEAFIWVAAISGPAILIFVQRKIQQRKFASKSPKSVSNILALILLFDFAIIFAFIFLLSWSGEFKRHKYRALVSLGLLILAPLSSFKIGNELLKRMNTNEAIRRWENMHQLASIISSNVERDCQQNRTNSEDLPPTYEDLFGTETKPS